MDESHISSSLRGALVMPTFMRRMSDSKPISPSGLLRVKVMAMMPRARPNHESPVPTPSLRCRRWSCWRQWLHARHGTRSYGAGKALDCSHGWRVLPLSMRATTLWIVPMRAAPSPYCPLSTPPSALWRIRWISCYPWSIWGKKTLGALA